MTKPFVFVLGAAISGLVVWMCMFIFWITPLRREHSHMRATLSDAASSLTVDAVDLTYSNDANVAIKSMLHNAEVMRVAGRYNADSLFGPDKVASGEK